MVFKDGQEVIIKNPRALVGKVVRVRPADRNLPEEQRLYSVRIEDERFYRATDLEPAEQPGERLEPYSKEWIAEMQRMTEAGTRWLSNNNDRAAWDQLLESGRKLGWIVPIKE